MSFGWASSGKSVLNELDQKDRRKIKEVIERAGEVREENKGKGKAKAPREKNLISKKDFKRGIHAEIGFRLDKMMGDYSLSLKDRAGNSVANQERRFWNSLEDSTEKRHEPRNRSASSSSSISNQMPSRSSSSRRSLRKDGDEDMSISGEVNNTFVGSMEPLSPSSIQLKFTQKELRFAEMAARSFLLKLRLAEIRTGNRELRIKQMVCQTISMFLNFLNASSNSPSLAIPNSSSTFSSQLDSEIRRYFQEYNTSTNGTFKSQLEIYQTNLLSSIKAKIISLEFSISSLSTSLSEAEELKAENLRFLLHWDMNQGEIQLGKGKGKGKTEVKSRDENREMTESGREVLKRLRESIEGIEKEGMILKGWKEVTEL